MGDFSRDSFKETQNILNDLRGLVSPAQPNPRHYVSIRLQQGVPVLDADWNEQEDIRRMELEMLLAQAIGSGVPAGSDGFRIREAGIDNDFFIETGLLFLDGWLVYNPVDVKYSNQPHRNSAGVTPELPIPLEPTPVARLELVYLDAWEQKVDKEEDEYLVDPHIGVETCTRLERQWVVRMEPIDASADTSDPATIPNRQPGHQYYPLATIDRPAGGQISASMITDLRRTHLTLDALTHAPLFVYDPVRDQQLDAKRLADAFGANLSALDDVFRETPDAFVFESELEATWSLMTHYQDLRALAVTLQEQALRDLLHPEAAMGAMTRFFTIQKTFSEKLQRLLLPPPDGISAGESTQNFLDNYNTYLLAGPESLAVAVDQEDVLGAVLAQERINHEISQIGGSRLDGTVSLSLISVTPNEPVVAGVSYQLTIHITSLLISAPGEEKVRVVASAGTGWGISFEASEEEDKKEIVVTVPNQSTMDMVLNILATPGAAPTNLELKAFPERRKLRVFRLPEIALAIGSEIIPGTGVIATLGYQGPLLDLGNIAQVSRLVMFNTGVPLHFRIDNLSSEAETFLLTITPDGSPTGWNATPDFLLMAKLSPGGLANVTVTFKTSDQASATSPQKFTVQLTQVVEDADDVPLTYTAFSITFQLI